MTDTSGDEPVTTGIVAAQAALHRLLGGRIAERFELALTDGAGDAFTVSCAGGRTLVEATSLPNLMAGVRWHVTHGAHGHLSRHGSRLPGDVPPPAMPIHRATRFSYRFAHNPTVAGYSAAYWGWPEWERELDFLSWCGTTHVLVFTGQEIVYRDLLVGCGLSESAARSWLSMPAHMPWQWMGNLYGYGDGQPAGLLERRALLGRRIVERTRELGMTPVLPGFAGCLPRELVAGRADLRAVPQGPWAGFDRPTWIDPTSAGFPGLAARWYRLQTERFGPSTMYSMDVMHEGGAAGEVDVPSAMHAIQDALVRANPDASWAIQAWRNNPTEAMLAGLDPAHLMVLDINADDTPRWVTSNAFGGAPWAFGTISTWGGRQYVFGRLPEICRLPGLRSVGRLCGTVQAAESLESNPVVDELLADAIWHEAEIDLDEWLAGYARRRYGASSKRSSEAWRDFARTAYGQHIGDNIDGSKAGPDSLFVARPGLEVERAFGLRPRILPYDADEFEAGWRELLAAAPELRGSEGYEHDLVDVTVQVLSNRSRWLLPQIRTAVRAGDDAARRRLSDRFLELLELCDDILATRREFLLGTWLAQASAAAGEKGVDDVLDLVTTWGRDRKTSALHDYAARHAAGLVADYYGPRWRHFFDGLRYGSEEPDWFALERQWAGRLRSASTSPRGDTIAVAHRIAATLPPPVSDTAVEIAVAAAGTEVTATITNTGERPVVLDRARLLRPPAEPLLGLEVALAPGESQGLHWALPTAPPDERVEVAVYADPSSSTTRIFRAASECGEGRGG